MVAIVMVSLVIGCARASELAPAAVDNTIVWMAAAHNVFSLGRRLDCHHLKCIFHSAFFCAEWRMSNKIRSDVFSPIAQCAVHYRSYPGACGP